MRYSQLARLFLIMTVFNHALLLPVLSKPMQVCRAPFGLEHQTQKDMSLKPKVTGMQCTTKAEDALIDGQRMIQQGQTQEAIGLYKRVCSRIIYQAGPASDSEKRLVQEYINLISQHAGSRGEVRMLQRWQNTEAAKLQSRKFK
jgi:hypothetical protein